MSVLPSSPRPTPTFHASSYLTPSVRPVHMVRRLEAASNRHMRRFVVLFLHGRAPVRVRGPPFSDEVAWLKAAESIRSYYGGPEFACPHCHANFWCVERCKRHKVGKGKPPVYNGCCRAGKVSLPGFHDWLDPLKELLRFDKGTLSSHFFTSMGAHINQSINVGGAPYVFKMCGVVFHRIGSFLPLDGRDLQFAQFHMVDSLDELRAPMANRCCFQALDRTLRDVLSAYDSSRASIPFGGKVVVFGGDFRQILPVMEGGSRNKIVDASLIMSPPWQHVQWVLDVGNGQVPTECKAGETIPSWLTIPEDMLLCRSPGNGMSAAIDSLYDNFFFSYDTSDYLAQRAIVCPTYIVADEFNDAIFDRVSGCAKVHFSYDSISKSTDHVADADILYHRNSYIL